MLELLKVIVQPVILERDDDGKVTGEQLADTPGTGNQRLYVKSAGAWLGII